MFKKSSKLLIRVSKRAVLIPPTWPLPPGQGSTNYFRRAQLPDHHHFSTVLSKHEMCYVNFWSTRSCCYFSNSEAGPTVWQQFLTLFSTVVMVTCHCPLPPFVQIRAEEVGGVSFTVNGKGTGTGLKKRVFNQIPLCSVSLLQAQRVPYIYFRCQVIVLSA